MTADERCELCRIKVAVNGPVRVVVARTAALDRRRGAAPWPRDARGVFRFDARRNWAAEAHHARRRRRLRRRRRRCARVQVIFATVFLSTGRRAHCFDESWLV